MARINILITGQTGRAMLVVGLGGLLVWGGPDVARAARPGAITARSPAAAYAPHAAEASRPDSVPLATITTDTGALAPGNKDFTRFTTPGMCLGAVELATDVARHTLAAQIAQAFQDVQLRVDTLPARVVAVARACGARFSVATTPPVELWDLFTLELAGRQDSVAHAVVERQFAVAPGVTGKLAVLRTALEGYLRALPTRLAAADSVLRRVDAFGTAQQPARMHAHQTVLQLALQRFDEPLMRREAARIIALGHEVPAAQMQGGSLWALVLAYRALAQLAYVTAPDSVPAVVVRAKRELGPIWPAPVPGMAGSGSLSLGGGLGGGGGLPDEPDACGVNFRTGSLAEVRDCLIPFNAEQFQGKALPPVSTVYWRPAAPTGWPPGDGRPSLILYGGYLANSCARWDNFVLDGGLTNGNCPELYAYLPQWVQVYGEHLAITLVAQAAGFAARSMVLSPAAEADSLAWFFRTQLKLPVTVGVVQDSVLQLPAIDGRRFTVDTSFYGQLTGRMPPGYDSKLVVVLYGARGTLEYVGALNLPVLHRLLQRTVATLPVTPESPRALRLPQAHVNILASRRP